MSEEMTNKSSHLPQYIQMSYNRLSPYQEKDEKPTLAIILRSTSTEIEPVEYEVPIPTPHTKEYQKAIHNILLQKGAEETLINILQKEIGIFIRKVIISKETTEVRQATIQTLSDFGEVTSFKASEHSAILYALMHKIPILVEQALTTRNDVEKDNANDTDILYTERDTTREKEKSYKQAIRKGLKPEDILKTKEDSNTLWRLNETELHALIQLAVDVENYEWAQFIKVHLEEREKQPPATTAPEETEKSEDDAAHINDKQ